MAKTTRRTQAVTDAHLTQPVAAPTPPSQTRPRKRHTQQQSSEHCAAALPATPINNAPIRQPQSMPRSGSNQALILGLLSRQQGASLAQMMAATGWLPHTTRAALTGLRQRGCTIERTASADGSSTYRIMNATLAAANGESA